MSDIHRKDLKYYMYTFGKNVFFRKPNIGWEEHVENTIFYYKDLYEDEEVFIFEDKGRKTQLKLWHRNPKSCKIEVSNGNNKFTQLYTNGVYSNTPCPKVYHIYKNDVQPNITKGEKNIAIVALATPNMKSMTDVSFLNHKYYAQKYNYNYLSFNDTIVDLRYVTWNKVFVLKQYLKKYDYVMWIDADAIFTNLEITIESIVQKNPDKYLWVCDDIGGWRLNTGVMIWKNSDWSLKVLEEWSTMEKIPHNQGAEQQQLINYLTKNDNNCCNWHVYNRRLFNTHPKEHKKGDFILHMMGLSGEERIKVFNKWNKLLGIS